MGSYLARSSNDLVALDSGSHSGREFKQWLKLFSCGSLFSGVNMGTGK